jgi:hypothetical protein
LLRDGLAASRAERALLSRAGVAPPRRPDAFVAQIEDTRADWYARGVGGAAAREINKIPAACPLIEESMFRAAGITSDYSRIASRYDATRDLPDQQLIACYDRLFEQ